MGKKRKLPVTENGDDEQEGGPAKGPIEVDLPARHLTTPHLAKEEKRLIVVLENAQLESAKVTNKLSINLN